MILQKNTWKFDRNRTSDTQIIQESLIFIKLFHGSWKHEISKFSTHSLWNSINRSIWIERFEFINIIIMRLIWPSWPMWRTTARLIIYNHIFQLWIRLLLYPISLSTQITWWSSCVMGRGSEIRVRIGIWGQVSPWKPPGIGIACRIGRSAIIW